MNSKLIGDFKNKAKNLIIESGTPIKQIEGQDFSEYKPTIYMGADVDDNSKFLINDKVVQGIKTKHSKEIEDCLKRIL